MLKKEFLSFKIGWKGDFSEWNKFIFVLKVFSLRIEVTKLNKRLLKFE